MELVELPTPSSATDEPVTRIFAVSRTGRFALVQSSWRVKLMHPEGFTLLPGAKAQCAAFGQDETRVVLAAHPNITVWDTASRTLLYTWQMGLVCSVRFWRDSSQRIVFATGLKAAYYMDVATGATELVMGLRDMLWEDPLLSPDGTKAIVTRDSGALVHDLETGAQLRTEYTSLYVWGAVHVSNDGKRACFLHFVSADFPSDRMLMGVDVQSSSPNVRTVSTRAQSGNICVLDAEWRWECELDFGGPLCDAFASEEVFVCVDNTGAPRLFRIVPLVWGQALALFCGVSGSLKRFLERDGDHAVMHRVLECLLF